MNPLKEEEAEVEVVRPWRNKTANSVKSIMTSKKKTKLVISKPDSDLSRKDIDRILENYDFQALHNRIMKSILK